MSSKTVIVTGASSGIGFAIARAYLRRGDNVVANARTLDRLQAAALQLGQPANLLLVPGDIAAPDTAKRLVDAAVDRFGQVDILVNNAGIFIARPFTEYAPDDVQALVDTNLKGFFFAAQAVVPHMRERRSGHIVNITASIAAQPLQSVPAVMPVLIKGGINQATRALALELAPHNIQVSAVAPGIIDTPLYVPEMHDFLNGLQPAGRIGTVDEVADAVLYLGDATFTTGVVLPVDGGMSAGRW
ncbi:NAD(P)-dependent dehydrogenase (short-subunit alcohol dehydrogenase family) [Pseudoxanthomonas sp. 3HH-4]|uniref:SDR family NAD(P)-dependent oxidoreductase n=1 Tax=Pseudoxanthomonas sp. 3HH-4 TaxID=1690214 RepID=UPI001151F53D|nr:SDR family NAD(P)-dependent oxidoreductase [Pseudoxanthomonas sp. 3HH-4]TQM12126.1 NAD(P)-dependent dehydrogenase (short-subunit alcohol dehydrogenase family) [Pseudoxanthomonas sp. 3HH-4]